MKRYVLVSIALLLPVGLIHAAVIPQMINYTGTVQVNGNPYNGDGYFRFALINDHNDCQLDPPGPNCDAYWSSDATSLDGEAPDNALKITVTNGLFSIKLGDTNRVNFNSTISMPVVPGNVFDHPLVYLRVWFDDAVNGIQRLVPDRQLVAVPFAYRAEVAEKLSGANSVTQENLAPASVTTAAIIKQAVTSEKIADGTITGADVDASTSLSVAGLQVGKSLLVQTDQGGSMELGGTNGVGNPETGGTPYLDFHYGTGTAEDFNARIVNQGDSVLNFQTKSAGNVMTVNGGNVGIGTTTPAGKLDVAGDIRAGNSDIYFTKTDHNHTGFGNTEGYAAIENSAAYNSLMILGRQQDNDLATPGAQGPRRVTLWDYVSVNGQLDAGNSDIYFTKTDHNHTGFGNAEGHAAIENAADYNSLMILGRLVGATRYVRVFDNLDVAGDINYVGTITDVSDVRLKENIAPITNALHKISEINGVSYNLKGSERTELGVIAQNVQTVLPELVSTVDPVQGYLGVNYVGMIPVLIEAIKEQQQQIHQLNDSVARLKVQLGQP